MQVYSQQDVINIIEFVVLAANGINIGQEAIREKFDAIPEEFHQPILEHLQAARMTKQLAMISQLTGMNPIELLSSITGSVEEVKKEEKKEKAPKIPKELNELISALSKLRD